MKILLNTNELLRAAEIDYTNQARYEAYLRRKARYEAQQALQDYLNKNIPLGSGQPDWYETQDQNT